MWTSLTSAMLLLMILSASAYKPKPSTGPSRGKPRATATAPANAIQLEPPYEHLHSRIQELSVQTAERWRLHDDKLQGSIAELFEFEHQRAATFERKGRHPYWADPRIHNFGNLGWRGFVHALVVPIATHAIDRFAYSGVDARKLLHDSEFPADAEVIDLCAGVGFSSARTGRVTAVDTSRMMLAVARLRRPDVKRFEVGNAEDWGETDSCDIATVMFGMHEMPGDARRRVLRNALRLARRSVLIVDIWPGFEPSPMMLAGEPFVLDYLANIDNDIDACRFAPVNVKAGCEGRGVKGDAAQESHYEGLFGKGLVRREVRGVTGDTAQESTSAVSPTLQGSAQWEVRRVDVVDKHVRMWKFERIEWGI